MKDLKYFRDSRVKARNKETGWLPAISGPYSGHTVEPLEAAKRAVLARPPTTARASAGPTRVSRVISVTSAGQIDFSPGASGRETCAARRAGSRARRRVRRRRLKSWQLARSEEGEGAEGQNEPRRSEGNTQGATAARLSVHPRGTVLAFQTSSENASNCPDQRDGDIPQSGRMTASTNLSMGVSSDCGDVRRRRVSQTVDAFF